MSKRPLSVTIIGWLFIVAGAIGLVYHASELRGGEALPYEPLGILGLRLLAIVCGIFVLRGRNWARWLLLAWIAYHVVLSAFHNLAELAVHALLLVVVAFFLLRRPAAAYFRREPVTPAGD